jgi:hypothetical protein
MDVIGSSSALEKAPAVLAHDASDICIETWSQIGIDQGTTVFRAEDHMDDLTDK